MDAGAHAGDMAIDLDPPDGILRVERSLDGLLGAEEGRHQAVAQALNDPAVVPSDHRLDVGPDLTQELEHGRVAGVPCPRGETDQVGEEERYAGFGLLVALRTRNVQATQSSFLLFFPLLFLTPNFVPFDRLSPLMETLARINR